MSDDNKFFRFVWRFNALVVAVAGLGVFALVAFAGYIIATSSFPHEKPEDHFTPVSSAAEAKNTYRLRSSGSLAFVKPGAQEVDLVFWLNDWDENQNPHSLKNMSGLSRWHNAYDANLLLVNTETGEGRWLFSGFSRNIESWDTVIDRRAKNFVDGSPTGPVVVAAGTPARNVGDTQSVVAVVLKVIDKDTNGDGVLDDKDLVSLYTYRLGDQMAVKLLDTDLLLTQTQVGDDRYAVSYEAKGVAWFAVYSVPDFKLLTKKPLPKLPG